MMRTLNFSKRLAIPAMALAISLTGATVFAQMGPGGPMGHGGPMGPGARGAGPGDMMAMVGLRDRLSLSTDQSAALDAILAHARAEAQKLHAAAQPTVAQINAELAKPQPNMRTLAQLRDSLQPAHEALRKATRDQMIGFYDTLNATQQQVVIEALRKATAWRVDRAARRLGP